MMVWAIAILAVWGVLGVVGDCVLSTQNRLIRAAILRASQTEQPPRAPLAWRLLARALTFFIGCQVAAVLYGLNFSLGTEREYMRETSLSALAMLNKIDERRGFRWDLHVATSTVWAWFDLGDLDDD